MADATVLRWAEDRPALPGHHLGVGEAVPYGQVCWSIANRDTDRPRAGEVITLGVERQPHVSSCFSLPRGALVPRF